MPSPNCPTIYVAFPKIKTILAHYCLRCSNKFSDPGNSITPPNMAAPSQLELYHNHPSFTDFSQLTDCSKYLTIPADWSVIVTDIVGSTRCIEEGRYKEVNFVGASSIAAVTNALDRSRFPSCFGGDGATLVLPPDCLEAALSALYGLRSLAQQNFDLELRVGSVLVREIERYGASVKVAKYELTDGMHVAFFKGRGVSLADRLVKQEQQQEHPRQVSKSVEDDARCSLEGLTCRWEKIPNQHGCILSLLAQAQGDGQDAEDAIISSLVSELMEVTKETDAGVDGDEGRNPVHSESLLFKPIDVCIRNETRYHHTVWSACFVDKLVEIMVLTASFRYGQCKAAIPGGPDEYLRATRHHADYRKFDDMVRMVIDCSPEEADQIEALLEDKRQKGLLSYGVHRSHACLMTCYVESPTQGNHIHYIDGDDGGYTAAARQLKRQLNALHST